MQIYKRTFLLSILCIIMFGIYDGVIAATTPTKSNTTNTKSPLYYNNDLPNNGALSKTAKDFAASNPTKAAEIMAANNNQCGIQCAKAMEAAASGGAGNSNNTEGTPQPTGTALKENNETSTDNILGISTSALRKGDVNMQSIVDVILNVISFLLGIAGTVSIFSLIYHAVKMQLNSGITGDSSGVESAKKGMMGALTGFVIAISAWFIITRVVQLLIEVS